MDVNIRRDPEKHGIFWQDIICLNLFFFGIKNNMLFFFFLACYKSLLSFILYPTIVVLFSSLIFFLTLLSGWLADLTCMQGG